MPDEKTETHTPPLETIELHSQALLIELTEPQMEELAERVAKKVLGTIDV